MSTAPLVRGYEVVIGFETHTQLSTASKIFSGAATAFGAEPNTQACAVDLALPGTLPVLNRGAVERAICFGLAVGAKIAPLSIFARKNYFYPDLPKGYQISQYEIPVVQGGQVSFLLDGQERSVRLVRAHLEEDAGKSLHDDYHGEDGRPCSGIDLNRAGTPLLEIVTEPDLRSSAEAVEYAKALHRLVVWLGICDGNMQEGSFRCDANVSVRRPGGPLGTRREIKNLNSFRFLQQAIDFEVQWQIDRLEDGLPIQQATVLFDPDTGETRAMRSKEDAQDYRYFPDPDLPPLVIAPEWVERTRAAMPELPGAMSARFQQADGLPAYDAAMMTQSRAVARYYEAARDAGVALGACRTWGADSENRPQRADFLSDSPPHSRAMGQEDGEKAAAAVDLQPATPKSDRLLDSDRPAAAWAAWAKMVANWLMGEISKRLNAADASIEACPVAPALLATLLQRVQDGTVSHNAARQVFEALWSGESDNVDAVIAAKGLRQMNDSGALEAIAAEVLAKNPRSVEEFRAGKDKAFNALVGQVMKATQGKANPAQAGDILRKLLAG